jgi:2,3-diketo-5-methylthiopentyl-1-phosphate enolase
VVFTIGYPVENTQGDIATLLVMVFGKVSLDGRIRLTDLRLPPQFLANLPGPRFGIDGVRRLLNEPDRPVLMSIFKPCVGLTARELGDMYREQVMGGSRLVKDDEILPDLQMCPTEERLEACLKAAEAAGLETGQGSLYAVNLTGRMETLLERARLLVSQGANCLLFNVLAYGYPALEALARDPEVNVPIVAHPAISGGLGSAPEHGIAYRIILGTLMRAAGADIVLFPSSYGSVALPLVETEAIRDALTSPLAELSRTFPGPSAGIHPGLVPEVLRDYGNDVVINAGGGVHGHPRGARAGARAFQQAIDQALHGRPLEDEAPPELAEALAQWSRA